MELLHVTGLNKYYGKHHVLKDVSFTLEAGEVLGFIGPNGSGKSTTMKCIANLVFWRSGQVVIAGHDLVKERDKALSHLSSLIEAPGLYPNLSGWENLKIFSQLRQVSSKRLGEVAEFTGLGKALKNAASTYSMGMKQRLALGIAILPKPTFLILDEPFNGLDPQGVFELRGLIKRLSEEGCGILFSSHQLLEMEKVSSRNIFIKEGRMVSQDRVQAEMAILNYKLHVDDGNHYWDMLNSLKEAGSITDFQVDESEIIIILPDMEHSAQALSSILAEVNELRGIMPVTANIESAYSRIYEETI